MRILGKPSGAPHAWRAGSLALLAALVILAVLVILAACAAPATGSRATPSPTRTRPTATPSPSPTPTLGPARYTPRTLAHGAGSPDDLTLDNFGSLLFTDQADGSIRRIEAGGTVTVLFQGLNEPDGIVWAQGTPVFSVQGKNGQGVDEIEYLLRQAGEPFVLTTFTNHTGMPGLDGIGADPITGDLIVPDSPNGKVYRITWNPGSGAQSTTLVASGFVRPTDAITDRAGNIYVADEYGNRVARIAPNGSVTTLARLGLPDDLAFDVDGTLLVTELQGSQLVRLDPTTGQVLATLATNLHEPQGLAVDSAGDIYVSEELANTILELKRG
ncbi:MAG TPA: hypothetical protein VIG30_19050 [Ktedonobacterales bacterium]